MKNKNFFDYPLKEQGKIIKQATIEANKKQAEFMSKFYKISRDEQFRTVLVKE